MKKHSELIKPFLGIYRYTMPVERDGAGPKDVTMETEFQLHVANCLEAECDGDGRPVGVQMRKSYAEKGWKLLGRVDKDGKLEAKPRPRCGRTPKPDDAA